jgi:predicted AAA+ superfamily ATPase
VAANYVTREADHVLGEMLEDHAAVLVTGPRATGKSTTCERFARSLVGLGNRAVAVALRSGVEAVLSGRDEPVLIDEWQVVPDTLQFVKAEVDRQPGRGRFIVTGSVDATFDSATWPGTGRLVGLSMFGLTERELAGRVGKPSWLSQVLSGDEAPTHRSDTHVGDYVERALRSGFPEPVLMTGVRGRARWLASYVDHVVTRDAQSLAPRRDSFRLRAYLTALALNSAGVVDDTTLWSSAGIAKDTARAYETLLRRLFVVDHLPAWTSNRLKRLSLAPKRYLIDPGLFVGVLGVEPGDVLVDGGLLGRVLETFVVAQCRAECALMTPAPRLHHLRSREGREIDLLIEVGARRLVAIEVKATATPNPTDARHLRWLRRELGGQSLTTVLLHTGPETLRFEDGTIAAPISALWS